MTFLSWWEIDLDGRVSCNLSKVQISLAGKVCLSVTNCDKRPWQSLPPKAGTVVLKVITLKGGLGLFFHLQIHKSCNVRVQVIYPPLLEGTLNPLTHRLHRIALEVNPSMAN